MAGMSRKEQAREQVQTLFDQGGRVSYSDIVELLGINLATAVEICDELMAAGEIRDAGDLR